MSAGWGAPCTQSRVRITSGEARVIVARELGILVKALMDETQRRGYHIRREDTGGYNCRHIGNDPSKPWSEHAFATALDINWNTNPWRSPLTTDMPSWMVDLWETYGFRWGGRWRRPDPMHYEFGGTPADAARYTALILGDLGGGPGTYTVQPGDGWITVANACGCELEDVLRANGATVETMIHPGQVVRCCGDAPPPPPPPPPPELPPVDFPNEEYGLFPLDPGKQTLRVASPRITGPQVLYFQWVAYHQGLTWITRDGIYGDESARAARELQGWNDLPQDGIVGWDGGDGRNPGPDATWPAVDAYASR